MWQVHFKAVLCSTISTVGQAFTWFAIYELTMTYCPYTSPPVTPDEPQCDPAPSQNAWKPTALLFIGLALFFATDAFISAAFLDDDLVTAEGGGDESSTAKGKRSEYYCYYPARAAT